METTLPFFRDPSQSTDARIHDLLSQMTLAEKVGQMTQIENLSIAPQDVTDYLIGSVLSGGNGIPQAGNNPQNWAKMVYDYVDASLHTRLGIPLVYGADAVHGHNGVKGATIFPHNIALGATRNPDLVRQIGQATAQAMLATGIYWNFAPAVSVPPSATKCLTEGITHAPSKSGFAMPSMNAIANSMTKSVFSLYPSYVRPQRMSRGTDTAGAKFQ